MGGYGSTRWNDHYRTCTTNEAYSFDLASVDIKARMQSNKNTAYLYNWTSNGKPSGNMGVYYFPDRQALVFKFQVSRDNQARDITQKIMLEAMPLHFGGVRYWMQCSHCSKRVRTLHCPPNVPMVNTPFRCRDCWKLTYASSQDSRKPRGYLYELLDISDKADKLNRQLRRCHRGSKNYKRLSTKISKLYARYDALLTLQETKSAQMKVKIHQLLEEMG